MKEGTKMRLSKMRKLWAILVMISMTLFLPSQGAKAQTSNIKGIDVSGKYNGTVDWDAVASQGYTFAMIRIAEGQAPDVDSEFENNYAGAKAAGLKVGVYHDCCIRTPEDALKEADYCIELLDNRELDYPVAYDIEKTGSFAGGIENTTALAKAYCDAISDAGYTPMIYSTAYHLSNDFDWTQLDGVKVWVAHYGVDETTFTGSYDLWQYTDEGSVEGANTDTGKCDLNYSFLEAESLTLSESEITLGIGETLSIDTEMEPVNCTDTIKWVSSDKSVATVSQKGKITAKAKGTATITVKTGSGLKEKMTVTVKKAPKSITLKVASKKLTAGKTYQITPVVTSGYASNTITYKSNNKKIAVVSSNGKVRAKSAGTTTITVTTYNNKTTTFKITVK